MTEARSFLGFASYYRRFIPDFATIASPIHAVTGKGYFQWNEKCESAFCLLKELLTSAPVLAYPMEDVDFILDTDASNSGIGAVLSQIQDGLERPIAYASRVLSKSQRRYCTTTREMLAVVRFTDHFGHYLLGRKFVLRTDHASLLWLVNFKEPEGMMARWITSLAAFHYTPVHRPGAKHANADGLSRRKCNRPECKDCNTPLEETGDCDQWEEGWIESGVYHVEEEQTFSAYRLVDPHEPLQEDAPDPWLDGWAVEDISKAQKADPEIARYLELVTYNKPKPERSSVTGSGPMGWKLSVQKGLLYIVQPHKRSPSLITPRLVTPRPIRQEIFNSLHGTRLGGHLGINRSVEQIQNNFFWPGLYSDTLLWCSQCPECAQSKEGPMPKKAGLKQQPVGMPLERMAEDIVGPLPITEKGNLYILIVVDYFTKWAEAFPLTNKSSMAVADSIVTQVMCRIGTPYQFHSDQGGEFDSNLFRDVCELLDVEKTRTTPTPV